MGIEKELDEMRQYAAAEAEQAGVSPERIPFFVDLAMSCRWETGGRPDRDYFEEMVAAILQDF